MLAREEYGVLELALLQDFLKLVFTLVVLFFSLDSTSSNIAPSSALLLPPAEGLMGGGGSLQLLPGRGAGS